MDDQVIKAFDDLKAKMAESSMLRTFKLNSEKFGFEAAVKGLSAFVDDIQDIIDKMIKE